MAFSEDFESGSSLATLGWTSLTNFANTSGEGLGGSTWGARGTGTLAQRANSRGNRATGITGRNFLIEFDLDHVDVDSSFRPTLDLLSGTVGSNSFFMSLDSDTGDGHIDLYLYEDDPSNPVWSSATGVVVAGTAARWSVCGEMSSANGVADGSLTFKINGVEQFNLTGVTMFGNTINGGQCEEIRIVPHGRLDNVSASDAGCVAAQIKGSTVFGVKTTVKSTRSFAIGLDDATNVHDESGKAKVFGNLAVTGYHELIEMTAPSGVANKARIYAVDNGSGKTKLMVIFGSGAAVQLAIEP